MKTTEPKRPNTSMSLYRYECIKSAEKLSSKWGNDLAIRLVKTWIEEYKKPFLIIFNRNSKVEYWSDILKELEIK